MGGILHATDFSEASAPAFEHALALALDLQKDLTLLHVGVETARDAPWHRFPHVRATLERWGRRVDGDDAFRRAYGVGVKKVMQKGRDAARAILEAEADRMPELLVLSRRAASGWFSSSVSGEVARKAAAAVLVAPEGARGFVDPQSGEVRVSRALAAVDLRPDPTSALREARWLGRARASGETTAVVDLVHVGPAEGMPEVSDALFPQARMERTLLTGEDAPQAISAHATATGAELILLATEGRKSLSDRLRGSFTERMLAAAQVPVLAIPAQG